MQRGFFRLTAIAVLLSAITLCAAGCLFGKKEEAKPPTPIVFLIPAGPGGGNDLTVRALIPGMREALGQDIVAENKPAGKGAVAAAEIMNGRPEDNKLYFNSQTLLLMPYGGMPDVRLERFQPVAQVVEDMGAVIVRQDAPFDTLADFIADAKRRGDKIRVAHNGVGSLWHLAAIRFAQAAGIDFRYCAYTTGGRQMLGALIDGEVEVCIISPSESKPFIDAKKVKVLAVMSDKRHTVVPNVPTCQEAGVDTVFKVWRGVFTTAGISDERLHDLEAAVQKAVGTVEFQAFARNNGLPVRFRPHDEFKHFIYEQREIYGKLFGDIDK